MLSGSEAEQVLVFLPFLVPPVRGVLNLLFPDRIGQIFEAFRVAVDPGHHLGIMDDVL
jgi:hypothetical protein